MSTRFATLAVLLLGLGALPNGGAAAPGAHGRERPPSSGGATDTAIPTSGQTSARAVPVVAVFGDVFAGSIVRGLTDHDVVDPGWKVNDRTTETASLTEREADEPARLVDGLLKDTGPIDAAVLMLGRNDNAPFAGQKSLDVGSPAWLARYGDRIEAMAAAFRDHHVPLIWVGLPIVRDAGEARLYAAINEDIRDRAVKAGAIFVDAWQAFADDDGAFTLTGPDVNGRPATLRWTNGWNFTRVGAQKLASFVLPDLKRIKDRLWASRSLAVVPQANPETFDQALSIDVNAEIRREAGLPTGADPAPGKPAGPVLALTAAPLSERGALLPVPAAAPAAPPQAAAPAVHPGRADDFTWPRRP